MRHKRRLSAVPATLTPPVEPVPRAPIGGDSIENAERAIYQSARVKSGHPIPPLPLTEAQAWAEAMAFIQKERTTHD